MRALRLMKGDTRKDRIRNVQIREKLNVVPLLDDVVRKKLRRYGHVKRMSEEKKPKQFLQWFLPCKRPLGSPRARWIQGIDKALEKRGTSIREVEESKIYVRRVEWRNFVKDSPADRL